uniref:FGF n=1 Tax=Ciona intestinalis TaxID=7719 RepID=H2XNQ4_CIOIN
MAGSNRQVLNCGDVSSTCRNMAKVSRCRSSESNEDGISTQQNKRCSFCCCGKQPELRNKDSESSYYKTHRCDVVLNSSKSTSRCYSCRFVSSSRWTICGFLKKTLTIGLLLLVLRCIVTEAAPIAGKAKDEKRRKVAELGTERNVSSFLTLDQEVSMLTSLPSAGFLDATTHAGLRLDVHASTKTKRGAGRKRKHRKRKGKKSRGRKRGKNKNRRNKKRRNKKQKSRDFTPDKINGSTDMTSQQNLYIPFYQRLYVDVGRSYHLAITAKGKVVGERSDRRSNSSLLEMRSFERKKSYGVAIVGVATSRYICVTKRGKVKAMKKFNKNRCLFNETVLPNKQNLYESFSCKGCYLHITKRGKIRNLRGTNKNENTAHFLPHDRRSQHSRSRRRALTGAKVTTVDVTNMTSMPSNVDPTVSSVDAGISATTPKHGQGKRSRPHKKRTRTSSNHGAGSSHKSSKATRRPRVYDATNR